MKANMSFYKASSKPGYDIYININIQIDRYLYTEIYNVSIDIYRYVSPAKLRKTNWKKRYSRKKEMTPKLFPMATQKII